MRACGRCRTILNDRSACREEEENRYASRFAEPLPDESATAASQWRWVKRTLLQNQERPTLSVLDVGCGHGAFLRAVQTDGDSSNIRAAGIELDPGAVACCRRSGLSVVHGSIFDVEVPDGPWDLITLWDVLDHLEYPRLALERLVRELAPGGALVVRGRNAALHAPLRAAYARTHRLASRLRVPDVSCVHRWGLRPSGYASLLRGAGLEQIAIHPGVPTPGDRYRTLGPQLLARAIKGTVSGIGMALQGLSGGRWYPFPSVLVTGRRSC